MSLLLSAMFNWEAAVEISWLIIRPLN